MLKSQNTSVITADVIWTKRFAYASRMNTMFTATQSKCNGNTNQPLCRVKVTFYGLRVGCEGRPSVPEYGYWNPKPVYPSRGQVKLQSLLPLLQEPVAAQMGRPDIDELYYRDRIHRVWPINEPESPIRIQLTGWLNMRKAIRLPAIEKASRRISLEVDGIKYVSNTTIVGIPRLLVRHVHTINQAWMNSSPR